ncbi:MAG: type II toxin-antitoxin system PemK/MazF family toxin [Bradyrhizobium sp.]
MAVKRGDVVLAVVPSELGRPRPGVIVQADEYNEDLSSVFVCPLSSDVQEGLMLRPIIQPAPSNGLRLRSQIMTDKMISLRQDRVRQVIGQIDSETSQELDRALLVVLGLAR